MLNNDECIAISAKMLDKQLKNIALMYTYNLKEKYK